MHTRLAVGLLFAIAGGAAADVRSIGVHGTKIQINGQDTFLVGYSNYGFFYHPEGAHLSNDPATQQKDLDAWMQHLQDQHINLMREGVFPLPTSDGLAVQPLSFGRDANHQLTVALNPTFWDFFHRAAKSAAAHGIVIEATVWDGYSLRSALASNPLNAFLPACPSPPHKSCTDCNPPFKCVKNKCVHPTCVSGTPYPDAYLANAAPDSEIYRGEKLVTQTIVRELAKEPNVFVEPFNEPASTSYCVTPQTICDWHAKFYGWVKEVAPSLKMSPNLVQARKKDSYNADQLPECARPLGDEVGCGVVKDWYPDPQATDASMVSLHGEVWLGGLDACRAFGDGNLGNKEVSDRVSKATQALVAHFNRPTIDDTDALQSGKTCSRLDDQLLWDYARGASQGGAAAIDHRDFEPYTVYQGTFAHDIGCMMRPRKDCPCVKNCDTEAETVDEYALDALRNGAATPAPPAGKFFPIRIPLIFDYTVDGAGAGHLVTREDGTAYHASFDGAAWSRKTPLPVLPGDKSNDSSFNLPRIVADGKNVWVVYGFGPSGPQTQLRVIASSDGGNSWTPSAVTAGGTIESLAAVVYRGALNIFTSEIHQDPSCPNHRDCSQPWRYLIGGAPSQLQGAVDVIQPWAAAAGNHLMIAYRTPGSIAVFTVAADGSSSVQRSDAGGGFSPGDPALAVTASGVGHLAHIPFNRAAGSTVQSFWHIFNTYPATMIHAELPRAGVTVAMSPPYSATNFSSFIPGYVCRPSIVADNRGVVRLFTESDGMVKQYASPNFAEQVVAAGVLPVAAINPKTGGVDVVYSGGASGLMRLAGGGAPGGGPCGPDEVLCPRCNQCAPRGQCRQVCGPIHE
jgi:hypothetical protein